MYLELGVGRGESCDRTKYKHHLSYHFFSHPGPLSRVSGHSVLLCEPVFLSRMKDPLSPTWMNVQHRLHHRETWSDHSSISFLL